MQTPPKKQDKAEKAKKSVLLRLSPEIWDGISSWAEDEFRSVNGQIEYLLREALRARRNNRRPPES